MRRTLIAMVLCLMAAAAFGAGAFKPIAADARSASGGKTPAEMPGVQLQPNALTSGGPPGSYEIQIDDGVLANGWYMYDRGAMYANKLTPASYPASLTQVDIRVLTNGDPYWPWPDPHHDTFLILVWNPDANGYPSNPPLLVDSAQASGADTAAVTWQPPAGSDIIDSGSFYVGMQEDPSAAGFEPPGVDNESNYPNNEFYYYPPNGVWTMGYYNSGTFMFRCWWRPPCAHDMMTCAILSPMGTADSGVALTPKVVVFNAGSSDESNVPVRFTMPGYCDTAYIASITHYTYDTLTFPAGIALGGRGRVAVRCSTMLQGDSAPSNDAITDTIFIRVRDVQSTSIIGVPAEVDSGGPPITPLASVRNNGTQDAAFHVRITVVPDGYVSTESVYVQMGQSQTVLFDPWNPRHRGSNTMKCSTRLDGDEVHSNDYVTQSVGVDVHDAGGYAILAPFGDSVPPGPICPRGAVHNYGIVGRYIPAQFEIFKVVAGRDSGPVYASQNSVWVSGGGSGNIRFDQWTAVGGLWLARESTILDGDPNPANDTVSARFFVLEPGHDVGMLAILAPVGVVDSLPKTPSSRVKNFGAYAESLWAYFRIQDSGGSRQYLDSVSVPALEPGVTEDLSFPVWGGHHPVGLYSAASWAVLSEGMTTDTVRDTFRVVATLVDVGVTAIMAPLGQYDTIAEVAPAARVMNFGDFPISFEAFFAFNSTPAYSESISISNLSAGTESLVTFPTWAKPHAYGYYATLCSVYVAGDVNHSNDARTGWFAITDGQEAGWGQMVSLPAGGRHKNVKGGGALACDTSDGCVYAFKGNNTCELYRYSVRAGVWASQDSIPAIGRSGKTKGVKKGSSLTFAGDGKLYATKGGNTCEFWQYDPSRPGSMRWTEMANEVPTGSGTCKEGTSMASVTVGGTDYVYLLKGSATFEFYRYNADAGTWETMASAPQGLSGRPYRDGSSLACDGGDTIYCLKGSYNEFSAYSISNDRWVTLDTLPRRIPHGTRKTKVKDGSGIAFMDRTVYALKGANTNEFWTYLCDSHRWVHFMDLPTLDRKVKGGGALVAAPDDHVLYALRGNNTLEFWEYGFWDARCKRLTANGRPKDIESSSSFAIRHPSLSVAPNPFTPSLNPSISYSLPVAGNISLKLYDVTGKLVSTLVSGYHPAGSYSYSLLTTHYSLASGVYLLKFETESYATTSKLIIE